MWRWFPIGDSFVDVFSSRDTDSYIIQREIDSVNAWLESDKVGHIMRGSLSYEFNFNINFKIKKKCFRPPGAHNSNTRWNVGLLQ